MIEFGEGSLVELISGGHVRHVIIIDEQRHDRTVPDRRFRVLTSVGLAVMRIDSCLATLNCFHGLFDVDIVS